MENSEENKFYVYRHSFPDGSMYVGKGCGSRAYAFGKNKRGELWLRTASKYGMPKAEFLIKNVSEDLAYFIEEEAVTLYKERGHNLRNLAPGGRGPQSGMIGKLSPNFGRRHTEEWSLMMSEKNSGIGNPHFGMTHSEKSKIIISKTTKDSWSKNYEKMRSINVGRKHTKEHNEKIGLACAAMSKESRDIIKTKNTGKVRNPEQIERYKLAAKKRALLGMPECTKKKMSENQWQKDKKEHKFLGPDGQVYMGMRSDFSKEFGFSVNDLFRKGKKKRPHVKGWKLDGEYL
jgi:hypothetical protein